MAAGEDISMDISLLKEELFYVKSFTNSRHYEWGWTAGGNTFEKTVVQLWQPKAKFYHDAE